jgi:hypothetical protein
MNTVYWDWSLDFPLYKLFIDSLYRNKIKLQANRRLHMYMCTTYCYTFPPRHSPRSVVQQKKHPSKALFYASTCALTYVRRVLFLKGKDCGGGGRGYLS